MPSKQIQRTYICQLHTLGCWKEASVTLINVKSNNITLALTSVGHRFRYVQAKCDTCSIPYKAIIGRECANQTPNVSFFSSCYVSVGIPPHLMSIKSKQRCGCEGSELLMTLSILMRSVEKVAIYDVVRLVAWISRLNRLNLFILQLQWP